MSFLSTRYKPNALPHAVLLQASPRQTAALAQEYIDDLRLDAADYLWLPLDETIKVAEIRHILVFTNRTRSSSPLKLIIIPDATKLTVEAANALLKTLEEPPAHTHFLLGANNPEDLLPTILSRCQLIQPPNQDQNDYIVPRLSFNLLSEAFALSKTLAAGDIPLDSLLRSWVQQSTDPQEQELLLTYLTYLSTNPNRRLFLDNLFLERYNKKLKPQR